MKFLNDEQAARYGCYRADPTPEQLARFLYLSLRDMKFLATYRRHLVCSRRRCAHTDDTEGRPPAGLPGPLTADLPRRPPSPYHRAVRCRSFSPPPVLAGAAVGCVFLSVLNYRRETRAFG